MYVCSDGEHETPEAQRAQTNRSTYNGQFVGATFDKSLVTTASASKKKERPRTPVIPKRSFGKSKDFMEPAFPDFGNQALLKEPPQQTEQNLKDRKEFLSRLGIQAKGVQQKVKTQQQQSTTETKSPPRESQQQKE